MNDGLLKVNFVSLAQAGADIQKALTDLDTKLSQLQTDARPLVDTWEGAAQTAYYARQERWTRASDDLKDILRNIKVAVDHSAQDYATTESNAEKRFT
ncbi:WXG100 family type VII secretion target [Actinoplanes sp. NPDC026623]|jgi:early secretory antigenic target protein ESAT-6|uniref:WXG100 family type VII secretion target n=1 Tax=Actinoplanes sp. NPDC026623 TaxID=3155610 RepID=UPI003403C091